MNTPEFLSPADFRERCDLVIAEVWQVNDPKKVGWLLTKYRLEGPDGDPIGVFHTPANSRLSVALLRYIGKQSP